MGLNWPFFGSRRTERDKAQDQGAEPISTSPEASSLGARLSKMRRDFSSRFDSLRPRSDRIGLDARFFEELEELLIGADLGAELSDEIVSHIRTRPARFKRVDDARDFIRAKLTSILAESSGSGSEFFPESELDRWPKALFVVGVNGSGKTTTVAKLAHLFKLEGRSTLIAAADTFRAAAIEQLEIWAERVGSEIVKRESGANPSAVVHDAIEAAKARGSEILLIDTAGRLQNKAGLMAQARKMSSILDRALIPTARLLVIDGSTGRNGLSQAREFHEVVGADSIALTKLDGSAKGGIVFSIARELKIPVRFIGVGEGLDDLKPFDPELFVKAIL